VWFRAEDNQSAQFSEKRLSNILKKSLIDIDMRLLVLRHGRQQVLAALARLVEQTPEELERYPQELSRKPAAATGKPQRGQ
jgi:hypothetical protein